MSFGYIKNNNEQEGKIFGSIQKKIENKNFSFSEKEMETIRSSSINRYYGPVYTLIYNTMSFSDSKYDFTFWENYFKFFKSLNVIRVDEIIFRCLRYNNQIYKHVENKDISSLSIMNAYKAYVQHMATPKNIPNIKVSIINMLKHRLINIDYVFKIVDELSPFLWKDRDSFLKDAVKYGHKSSNNVDIINKIKDEIQGSHDHIYIKNIEKIILSRSLNYNNRRVVFKSLSENGEVLDYLIQNFSENHKNRLLLMMKKADFREFEENEYGVVNALLKLDPSFIDKIQESYISSLCGRWVGHMHSNMNKLVKFLKTYPTSNPKKALLQLSQLNKNDYISQLVKKFPELQKFELMI